MTAIPTCINFYGCLQWMAHLATPHGRTEGGPCFQHQTKHPDTGPGTSWKRLREAQPGSLRARPPSPLQLIKFLLTPFKTLALAACSVLNNDCSRAWWDGPLYLCWISTCSQCGRLEHSTHVHDKDIKHTLQMLRVGSTKHETFAFKVHAKVEEHSSRLMKVAFY